MTYSPTLAASASNKSIALLNRAQALLNAGATNENAQFLRWLAECGGPSMAHIARVSDLAAALQSLKRLALDASYVQLGKGMIAGRLYYSRLGLDRERFALQHDDPSVVRGLADLMLEFNAVTQADPSVAETMAQHMASADVDVLNQLYDSAPTMFAQGMVLSWMGALAPWTPENVVKQ